MDISLLQFDHLKSFKNIIHFTTNRYGGVSHGNYASLNCSFHAGDQPVNVKENLRLLAEKTGIESNRFIFPQQTHSDHIRMVDEIKPDECYPDTDALITRLKNIAICVTTADCVPLTLYSPDKEVIAVVHAGWRGQVKMLPFKTAEAIKKNFHADPLEMVAAIGPCISAEVYETSEEVAQAVRNTPLSAQVIFEKPDGKFLLDLAGMTRQQLLFSGLKNENIMKSGICTFRNHDYFSARRDGFHTGRFVTCMMMKA